MFNFSNSYYYFLVALIIIIGTIIYYYKKTRGDNASASNAKFFGKSILSLYSSNYNQLIKEGKITPVIGREKEVQQLIEVLSRKNKNNALLLGKPGVGKTAIVERLAALIVAGDVPDNIKNKEIISLDLASLVSGTKYRGELEKRLEAIKQEFNTKGNSIILFIDEIQQLSQIKGSEGGLGPGDILKPELARGYLQVIGATTYMDYEKYIAPEESLDRRFHPIHVHEPSKEEVLAILQGIRNVYENFHHVKYPDNILDEIIDYANKKISGRYMPDKAIDIMDEVGVHVHLNEIKRRVDNKEKESGIWPTVSSDDVKNAIDQFIN